MYSKPYLFPTNTVENFFWIRVVTSCFIFAVMLKLSGVITLYQTYSLRNTKYRLWKANDTALKKNFRSPFSDTKHCTFKFFWKLQTTFEEHTATNLLWRKQKWMISDYHIRKYFKPIFHISWKNAMFSFVPPYGDIKTILKSDKLFFCTALLPILQFQFQCLEYPNVPLYCFVFPALPEDLMTFHFLSKQTQSNNDNKFVNVFFHSTVLFCSYLIFCLN